MIPKVIQCGDHTYAPYSIVCIHLIDGNANIWIPIDVDDGREVENDWACPACYKNHKAGKYIVENLKLVCIHCLRKLRRGRR